MRTPCNIRGRSGGREGGAPTLVDVCSGKEKEIEREGMERNRIGGGAGCQVYDPLALESTNSRWAGVGNGTGVRIRCGLRSWSGCLGWDMIPGVLFPGRKDERERGK